MDHLLFKLLRGRDEGKHLGCFPLSFGPVKTLLFIEIMNDIKEGKHTGSSLLNLGE